MAIERTKDSYDLLCEALKNYLHGEGWELVVVGSPEIRKPHNYLKFNYEFVVKITAGRTSGGQAKEKGCQRKLPEQPRRAAAALLNKEI